MKTIEKMGREFESMTDGEKKIYRYIMKNVLVVSFKSINEVSDDLNISTTSLIRFAKRFGFSGYSQFKKKLQEEQIHTSSPGQRMKELYESGYIVCLEKTKDREYENISQMLLNIDDKDFNELIELILARPKIYTLGWDMSAHLSSVLNSRLKLLGFDCREIRRDTADFDVQLMHTKPGDVLVIFDFFRYSKSVERTAGVAKNNGACIILVTDDLSCPVCKHSRLHFISPVNTDLLMNSLVAPLFLINLIISEITMRLGEAVIDIFDRRHHLIENSGEYF